MMNKTAAAIAAIGLMAGTVGTASAQVKVATVDMNKIFSAYYKTKDAEARINDARAAAKKELDDRMDTHKTTLEEIKKLDEEINKPELSKDAKDEKGRVRDQKLSEFRNLEREINEFRSTREKQLQEQAVRMRNGIVEEITKIVQEKVKAENYDIVLDRSGNSLNGVPILVFAKPDIDFSEVIIDQLNKSKPQDAAPAPVPAAAPEGGGSGAKPAAEPKAESKSKKKD